MSALELYLTLSAFLFCLGVFLVLTRRNAIMALLGIELILNAANLNFVAFSAKYDGEIDGQMAALFVIVMAAAEVAVAFAIVLNVYQRFKTVNIEEYGAPCQYFCSSEVYEIHTDKNGNKELRIHAENCMHCKTCDIKSPGDGITWSVPNGGNGPDWQNM